MAARKKGGSPILFYSVCGILIGFLFPLLSCLIETKSHGNFFTLAAVIQAHKLNPLLWVIDTAPLFLGILGYLSHQKAQD